MQIIQDKGIHLAHLLRNEQVSSYWHHPFSLSQNGAGFEDISKSASAALTLHCTQQNAELFVNVAGVSFQKTSVLSAL